MFRDHPQPAPGFDLDSRTMLTATHSPKPREYKTDREADRCLRQVDRENDAHGEHP
jgi:hypothetical protein